MHPGLYLRVWIIPLMHVYVCLLASILYLHIILSRSRLCHALCPLWACCGVVASVPPRACLGVIISEIHLCGVGVLNTHLSLLRAMLICLPCLLCTTHLAFFTSLHLYTLANMFMHKSLCRPYSIPMELWALNLDLHLSS